MLAETLKVVQNQKPEGSLENFPKRITALYKDIYKIILSSFKDLVFAEDIAQETMVKALRFRDKFKYGNLRAWLLKIAFHVAINKKRHENLNTKYGIDNRPDMDMIGDPCEIEPMQYRVNAKIQEALKAVPAEFLQPTLMRDIYEYSYKEIATILDIKVGTVMSRIYRGRKLLREALKDYAEREHGITYQAAA